MPRTDTEYLACLRLLPAGYGIVAPGRTVVAVAPGRLGPQRRWPGTEDPYPLDTRAEVIASVIGDEYTIPDNGTAWSTELLGWYGCGPRYAIVGPDPLAFADIEFAPGAG